MSKKRCPHCGASMAEYRFGLNTGLIGVLRKLYDYESEIGGPAKMDDLGLSYAQRTNSQKLAYWNLAHREHDVKAGYWKITETGQRFIEGRERLHKYVWTYRGEVQRFDGDFVRITDIQDGYKYRYHYQSTERMNHADSPQQDLFA